MGKEFCHSWLCWRRASGVPNPCDLYVAVESPCFILLSSEFTIGTVLCISKDFRFYWDCIWCRMCLMSRFVWEGHPSSFVHVELRLVGDGVPFEGSRNWSGHLQSSLCFLCPPELQQKLPGQRRASLDAQFHGGQGWRWQWWPGMLLTRSKGILPWELPVGGGSTFPPSEKETLLLGEGTGVPALCRVSLLILGFFGTDAPPASVPLRFCCGRKSCWRGWMTWERVIYVACSFKPIMNWLSVWVLLNGPNHQESTFMSIP